MSARILIVEDNPANLDLMRYLLEHSQHHVTSAASGSAALQAADAEIPDLVLLDLQLPDIDGFEVLKLLRSKPGFEEVPVIAITAYAMVGDRDLALAKGFEDYIAKPIEPEKFVAQLEAHLSPEKHGVAAAASSASRPSVEAATQVPQTRGTILVVDDNVTNITLLRKVLEPNGFRVLGARSVEEGLEIARAQRPVLIISDIHMEGLGGITFIRFAQDDPDLARIPFGFLTSSARVTDWEERGEAEGARFVVGRPVENQELLDVVMRSIGETG